MQSGVDVKAGGRKRGQSAVEYLTTYGWALLIVAILISVLYLYINEPNLLVTNSCNFINGLYCQEIVLVTNTITHNTLAALFFTNSNPYPLNGISSYLHINNVNTTSAPCYPVNIPVPPGGQVSCVLALNVSTAIGSFLSGSIYVNATYCGLTSSYQSSKNCSISAASSEIYKGNFAGHTQQATPENIIFTTPSCGMLAGNVATIDGSPYSCNALVAKQFYYNLGTTHTFSFVNPDTISSSTRGIFYNIILYNTSYTSNSGAVIIVRNDQFTFNYSIQYTLTEVANKNGGVLLPNSTSCFSKSCIMWYNANSVVSISAIPPQSKGFIGWKGSGSGSYTGNNPTATITMNGNVIENAYFTH